MGVFKGDYLYNAVLPAVKFAFENLHAQVVNGREMYSRNKVRPCLFTMQSDAEAIHPNVVK
jgi:hypothetical protein